MTREEFEEIAQKAFDSLPDLFRNSVENLHVVVEDYPPPELVEDKRYGKYSLLGLYQGIPITHRGTWYGMSPTGPDKISLYQKNIESSCRNEEGVQRRIVEVLFHELGHYFGMNEAQIRNAMRNFK
jgi:predicted Zn-dependent protease with MMP-like domain